MTTTQGPRVSVVVVTYKGREAVHRCLPALSAQLRDGDELIVSDNASPDGTADEAERVAPTAKVIRRGSNDGFAAACAEAAAAASGDLIAFVNPDTVPAPGFRDAIARPHAEGRGWSAWMGLVTMDQQRLINTSGGVIHFTGISWAGEAGLPIDRVDPAPREVAWASGACFAIPAEVWRSTGGLADRFFLYFEDVDLSLRVRLAGGRVGIEPSARVDHDYEFSKGQQKWRMLERNRCATLIRTYPTSLLVLLAPALLLTELAVHGVALRGGWWRQKVLATLDVARDLRQLARERDAIQRGRTVDVSEFASWLTADLSSLYLGRARRSVVLRLALRAYWRLVLVLLGAGAKRAG